MPHNDDYKPAGEESEEEASSSEAESDESGDSEEESEEEAEREEGEEKKKQDDLVVEGRAYSPLCKTYRERSMPLSLSLGCLPSYACTF